MPRQLPLDEPIAIPQIERGRQALRRDDFPELLGFSGFPDGVASELANLVATMRPTSSVVVSLTRQREALDLKRIAKKLRREQQTGRPNIELRQRLANPHVGWRTETFMRLAPLAAVPTADLLAAVEARRREVERLPRVNPQTEARESAAGAALFFFLVYAAPNVRDEPGAWWRFVLAALDEAGFPTAKLYQHPERLRPLLEGCQVAWRPLADQVRAGLAAGNTAEELLALTDQTPPGPRRAR
jgi:hypothetical protein